MDKEYVYRIVLLSHLRDHSPDEVFKIGEVLPLPTQRFHQKRDVELEHYFESVRQQNYSQLPSRIDRGIFVFADIKYHYEWPKKMYGRNDVPYIVLRLSYTGKITWFDANYNYCKEDAKIYWESAKEQSFDDPRCEGILEGTAFVDKIIDPKTI